MCCQVEVSTSGWTPVQSYSRHSQHVLYLPSNLNTCLQALQHRLTLEFYRFELILFACYRNRGSGACDPCHWLPPSWALALLGIWSCITAVCNFELSVFLNPRDKWVCVTTASCVLRMRMEERPPIWKVDANILNKQSRTADKG